MSQPPPTGFVAGRVTIDGQGLDGVAVALSDGVATETSGGGAYRFDGVRPAATR